MGSEWLDRKEYPFRHRRLLLEEGGLHYVDEGEGHPIVFVHGNPEWSFSFRKPIGRLSRDHRCIAPDHLGFGLSEKPPDTDLGPRAHAKRLDAFLEKLGIERFTLVMNDWGGPIGINVAEQHPERVAGLIVLNAWLWPLNKSPLFQLYSRTMGSILGSGVICRYQLLIRWGMPLGFSKSSRFDGHRRSHYEGPFPDLPTRRGQWEFGRSIRREHLWLQELWDGRNLLKGIPMLILKGVSDMAFTDMSLRKWQHGFPEARVQRIADAGHFPHEEQGEAVGEQIALFLSSIRSR